MSPAAKIEVLDLDEETPSRRLVILTFSGVKTALSKDRLLELLANEQLLIGEISGRPSVQALAPLPPPPPPTRDPRLDRKVFAEPAFAIQSRQIPGAAISHASLSTRIKKIYEYYEDKPKVLRPAHAGLLLEVIQKFDGVIPEHATTRLLSQLESILTWNDVPEDLRSTVAAFVESYTSRKRAE